MKRYILTIAIALATTLSAAAQKTIEILHTNDTHSCIMPLNPNLADTLVAGRGGFIRRMEMIRQEREANPDVLLFDSGDFSQGSPYYTLFKGSVETELMSAMKYDAVAIGNHEFDFGLENMARIFREAKFPVVCANYDFRGTVVDGLTKPYIILKRNGLRIGVFGISPKLDGLVDATKCVGVKYLDPVATSNKVARELRHDKKCDVVICLSHLGWDMQDDVDDEDMLAQNHDIDIVLGGHSHSYFTELKYAPNADGKPIPDDQNGKHAVFVGKIKLSVERK